MQIRHLIAVLAFATATVHAADRWWDGGTTNIAGNGNSASTGGDGAWNTTLTNWDAGAAPYVAWNNAATTAPSSAARRESWRWACRSASPTSSSGGDTIGGIKFGPTGSAVQSLGTVTLAAGYPVTSGSWTVTGVAKFGRLYMDGGNLIVTATLQSTQYQGTFFNYAYNGNSIALVSAIPTAVPARPTGVTASTQISADGSTSFVKINWGTAARAADYIVKRSTISGGPYTPIATTKFLTYNDTAVTVGQTYYSRPPATSARLPAGTWHSRISSKIQKRKHSATVIHK